MRTNTERSIFKYQTAAILIMFAGWGWIAGNFAAPFDTFWLGAVTTIGHFIPIALMLIFSLQFFHAHDASQHNEASSNSGLVGITVLAILAIVACITLVVLGASNSNPSAVGVKSIGDWIPAIILFISALLWLTMLIPARQQSASARVANNK